MDQHDPQPPGPPGRSSLTRRSSVAPALLGVAVVLALGAAWLWRSGALEQQSPPRPEPVDAGAAPVAAAAVPDSGVDAASGEALFRRLVGALSPAPELARWLAEPNLLARAVAAVDLVAAGESPRPVLGFLAPTGHFTVEGDGGPLHASPAAFARYDRLTQVLTSLDPVRLGSIDGQLAPFLRAAYKEIAPPGASFDARLHAALARLTSTPLPEGTPELRDGDHGYVYLDPKLEALPPAQKHLLRLGPANARALVAWLAALDRALPAP